MSYALRQETRYGTTFADRLRLITPAADRRRRRESPRHRRPLRRARATEQAADARREGAALSQRALRDETTQHSVAAPAMVTGAQGHAPGAPKARRADQMLRPATSSHVTIKPDVGGPWRPARSIARGYVASTLRVAAAVDFQNNRKSGPATRGG